MALLLLWLRNGTPQFSALTSTLPNQHHLFDLPSPLWQDRLQNWRHKRWQPQVEIRTSYRKQQWDNKINSNSNRSSTWIQGLISLLCRWLCTGTDCPDRLWGLPKWRYPGTVWTQTCAMCSAMALLEQRGWARQPTVDLISLNILWDYVFSQLLSLFSALYD